MDKQIGRRQALVAFGAMGAGMALSACGGNDENDAAAGTTTSSPSTSASSGDLFAGAGSCALTPELTEGPYYLDIDKVRSDIREDRQGARLRLAIRIRELPSCTPVADAAVDVWHCDALGLYSGFESASAGGGTAPDDTRYLRGTQVTNRDGVVEFTTVYPGWYRGRTVHIHCKVHLNNREALTTQLFFEEALTKTVYAQPPYNAKTGRDVFNDDDGIFSPETVLKVSRDGDGYLGVINLDVKRS